MKLSHKIALTLIRIQFRVLGWINPKQAAQKAFVLFCTPRRKKKTTLSAIIERAVPHTLTVNNYRLNGYSWNAGSNKKILVIHGFESTAANFDLYVEPLIQKGYEVFAFDAQAHGKSEGKTIVLPEYVQTLEAICRQFGPFDAYLAHSFGGLALAHLLEQMPHSQDNRVVLIAPATETVSAINNFVQLLQLNRRVIQWFNLQVFETAGIDPEHYSIKRAISHIRANVLWLHDKEDNITPFTDAEKVQNEQHKNVQFIVTQGLGHRKIYREPAVMQQIFDFL